MESWKARRGQTGFSSDISPNSKSSFSRTTASKSCIKFSTDAFILLNDSYTETTLVLFVGLAWNLPSKSPVTIFSLKYWLSLYIQLLYVQSVIAVPPRQEISQCKDTLGLQNRRHCSLRPNSTCWIWNSWTLRLKRLFRCNAGFQLILLLRKTEQRMPLKNI